MKKPSTRGRRAGAGKASPVRKVQKSPVRKVHTRNVPKQARARRPGLAGSAQAIEVQELEALRSEIERLGKAGPPRWNADPDDVRRSVAKLVLTLVEFIRQLLERQAIRRMEAGTLSAEQTEAVGLALMRLEETIRDLAGRFGLDPNDLNLDLGPVGRLI